MIFLFFFFNDTATTEIYTLSLHDALPISGQKRAPPNVAESGYDDQRDKGRNRGERRENKGVGRSEEHTSELQSHSDLVCRLLLEKKKKKNHKTGHRIDNCR